jgi:hypothetical protein
MGASFTRLSAGAYSVPASSATKPIAMRSRSLMAHLSKMGADFAVARFRVAQWQLQRS